MLIKHNHDELNAAMVRYNRTDKAMEVSRQHGRLNDGRWNNWEAHEVADAGKAKFKRSWGSHKEAGWH